MGALHRRAHFALFVVCATVFLLAPAILVPDLAVPAFLVLG